MSYSNGREMNGAPVALSRAMHYDRSRSVQDIVREQANIAPNATAVVFGDRSMTYGELDRLSDALAAHLVRLGIRRGDIVGLFLGRSLETIVAKLATLKAGAAYLPIDPAYPTEHLDYMISECAPKVVFVDGSHGDKIGALPSLSGQIVDLGTILPQLPKQSFFDERSVGGGDTAYIMYTSGSTGRPKGVAVSHRGIARIALDQNYVDIHRRDVILHTATIGFDIATFEIWGALLNGCLLAGVPDCGFSLPRLCEVVRQNGVTITLLTTGLFNLFADYGAGDLPSLRQVMFGGEVGSAEHARRFLRKHPGCKLTNGYGPTEATVIATAYCIPPNFQGHELPIGKAVAHTGILILDDNLVELPAGAEGQLAITGDGLANGYVNRPDLTEDKFPLVQSQDGPVRCYLTGDIAIKQDDETIVFKGRRDRQIKLNGKRIELDEIEAALRRDHRLLDAAVVCHDHGAGVKRIVAYLCPQKQNDLNDPEFTRIVMSTLRTVLPAYMIPSVAVALKELPLTAAGKVERTKLLPPPVADVRLTAPQSRCEEIVTRLWRQALATEAVSVDRNFFDLGGTSLQLLRVHAGLEEELDQTIDVFKLFQHPTIRELVRFLEAKSSKDAKSAAIDQRAVPERKTLSQFRRSTL